MHDSRVVEIRVLQLATFALVGLLAFGVVEPESLWLPAAAATTFCLAELAALWWQLRKLRACPQGERRKALGWLARSGWTEFFFPFIAALTAIYFLAPAFYVLSEGVVKTLFHPPLKSLASTFSHHLWDAVRQQHTIMLPGESALAIHSVARLFEPRGGLEQLWRESIPGTLPYVLPALALLLLSRVAIPWAYTKGRAAPRIVIVFLLTEVTVRLFEYAVEHWFGFSAKGSGWLRALPYGFGVLFALMVDQLLKEQEVFCPDGHPNPAGQRFCGECAKPLPPAFRIS